eukprot:13817494-Ditylum_brightwellii.AAC.1
MVVDLLHEQNLYSGQYGDFCLGGLHKAVLNFELNDGSTLWSTMLDEASIVDIHSKVFTSTKGILTIEMMKKDIQKAIQWS